MLKSAVVRGFLAVTVTVAFSFSAKADWQFTRWGMSPEQVVAASNASVLASEGRPGEMFKGYRIGAEGSYVSGNYQFRTVFYFGEYGLAMVYLNADDADASRCLALRRDLEGLYGKPYRQSDGLSGNATWQDTKSNNSVVIEDFGSLVDAAAKLAQLARRPPPETTSRCSIKYSPLTTDSAKGL